jgi:hypothetical protein
MGRYMRIVVHSAISFPAVFFFVLPCVIMLKFMTGLNLNIYINNRLAEHTFHNAALSSIPYDCSLIKDRMGWCSEPFYTRIQEVLASNLGRPGYRLSWMKVFVIFQSFHDWFLPNLSQFISPTWHAVAQLIEALCEKQKGHGFDSRCHWIFQFT